MAPALTTLGLALIALAGLVHVGFFVLEALVWDRVGRRIFGARVEHLEAIRPWAANQGWYNLFLAIGAIGGAVAALIQWSGAVELIGGSVAAFAALCMGGAAIVLLATNRSMLRGALLQGTPPVLGLIALAFGALR